MGEVQIVAQATPTIPGRMQAMLSLKRLSVNSKPPTFHSGRNRCIHASNGDGTIGVE